jgi:hypothetical protein
MLEIIENTDRWYIAVEFGTVIMKDKLDGKPHVCFENDAQDFLENLEAIRELYSIPMTDQYAMTWNENLDELFRITWSKNG